MLVRALIFIFAVGAVGASVRADEVEPSSWRFDAGLALSAQWHREINPDFGEIAARRDLFATAWFRRFGLGIEYGQDPVRRSQSGAFSVATQATRFATWGRYAYADWGTYVPYVALGGGVTSERITTSFQSAVDQRRGTRRFLGLGAGVGARLYRWILIETEARLISEETVKSPGLALVLRLGVTF